MDSIPSWKIHIEQIIPKVQLAMKLDPSSHTYHMKLYSFHHELQIHIFGGQLFTECKNFQGTKDYYYELQMHQLI
jgi:hypothetical protein